MIPIPNKSLLAFCISKEFRIGIISFELARSVWLCIDFSLFFSNFFLLFWFCFTIYRTFYSTLYLNFGIKKTSASKEMTKTFKNRWQKRGLWRKLTIQKYPSEHPQKNNIRNIPTDMILHSVIHADKMGIIWPLSVCRQIGTYKGAPTCQIWHV